MKKLLFAILSFFSIMIFADIRSYFLETIVIGHRSIETISASKGFDLSYHRYNGTLFYKYKQKEKQNKNVLIMTHGGAFIVDTIFGIYFKLAEDLMLNSSKDFDVILIDIKGEKYPEQNKELNDVIEFAKSRYDKIALIGDSSGGNITLSTILKRRDENKSLVDAIILMSPWLDLSNMVKSRIDRRDKDIALAGSELPKLMVDNPYIKGQDIMHPYISPIYGEYKNFPKILIQVGENEILYDDSYIVYQKMKDVGVDVIFEEYEGMYHVFQLFTIFSKTNEAKENMVKFLDGVFYDKRVENK